jgi:hypothetical protein
VVDLYEVLLVDEGQRWHAGWEVDDDSETDVLLREHGKVVLFRDRAGLEALAERHGRALQDDLPDEVDLDLGGWLSHGMPLPSTAEVSELWHLLYDDPDAGHALAGEELGEAYDDLVEDEPDWFSQHGPAARAALCDAVRRLRGVCVRA